MTVQELWKEGNRILSEAGLAEATLDSRYLLEWMLQCNHSFLLLNPHSMATQEQITQYFSVIEKRKEHIPLQYIIGEQEFMGYAFRVNENVLIPRQDTEVLVETVLEYLRDNEEKQDSPEILDLCCGSGCIGISIWKQRNVHPSKEQTDNPCSVTLSDISQKALAVAQENAKRLEADVQLRESNLFERLEGRYDIIVSNPPYIPSAVVDTLMPEVRDHEPRLALDGTEDGLHFYRLIIKQAKDYLKEEGYVFFEIGFDQAEDVRKIFVEEGYESVVVKQDLAGLDRVIYAKRAATIV